MALNLKIGLAGGVNLFINIAVTKNYDIFLFSRVILIED